MLDIRVTNPNTYYRSGSLQLLVALQRGRASPCKVWSFLGACWKCRIQALPKDLLNENLNFNTISWICICTITLEKHCWRQSELAVIISVLLVGFAQPLLQTQSHCPIQATPVSTAVRTLATSVPGLHRTQVQGCSGKLDLDIPLLTKLGCHAVPPFVMG